MINVAIIELEVVKEVFVILICFAEIKAFWVLSFMHLSYLVAKDEPEEAEEVRYINNNQHQLYNLHEEVGHYH